MNSSSLKRSTNTIYNFFEAHTFLCFFITLSIISFWVYKDFLLFQRILIYTDVGNDMFAQTLPGMAAVSDHIRTGYPWYMFNVGLGHNMYVSALGEPLMSFALLMGKSAIPLFMGYMQAARTLLAGVFFYLYLRQIGIHKNICFIVAILYAFCGHMIGRAAWSGYPNEVVWIAFVLYAIERYVMNSKWKLLPVAICVMCLSLKSFSALIYVLFLFVYAIIRYLSENKTGHRHFAKFLFKNAALFAIGAGMSAVIFMPSVLYGMGSARISGDYSLVNGLMASPVFQIIDGKTFFTAFFRTVSIDALGTGSAYTGAGNYLESPLFYCGISALFLLPQVLFIKDKKRKYGIYFFLAIAILYLVFPYVRYASNGFASPYFRNTSFFIIVAMLYSCAVILDGFARGEKLNLPVLYSTVGALILLGVWGIYRNSANDYGFVFQNDILLLCCLFICVYIVLAILFAIRKVHSRFIFIILALAVSLEAGLFSYNSINNRTVLSNDFLTQKISYNDYTNEAVDYLNSRDESGFFRTETAYNATEFNSSLYQNYYGTKSYTLQPKEYLNFLNFMNAGLIKNIKTTADGSENYLYNFVYSFNERYMLNTMLAMKYILSKEDDMVIEGYEFIGRQGDVYIYENKNALPIGFAYDQYIYESELINSCNIVKDLALLNAVVLEDNAEIQNGLTHFDISAIINNLKTSSIDLTNVQIENAKTVSQETNQIKVNAVENDPMMMFSFDSDAQMAELDFWMNSSQKTVGQIFWKDGSEAFSEGKSVFFDVAEGMDQYSIQIPATGFDTLRLDFGAEAGGYEVGDMSMNCLPADLYEQAVNMRKESAFVIIEFSQNDIRGEVQMQKQGLVFFSILQDKGWHVQIDGEEAKTVLLDKGFIGTYLDTGKHTIELSFVPPYMKEGIIVSICAILIYAALILLKKIKKV